MEEKKTRQVPKGRMEVRRMQAKGNRKQALKEPKCVHEDEEGKRVKL